MASVMTGLYPFAHGATGVRSAIRPEARTLAEILAAHGYATAAFVTNVNVSGAFGFARGFESFTYLPEDPSRPSHHVLSDVLTRDASRWLESRDGRPFFLYVHSTDPHAPYTAGAELRPRFRSAATTAAAIDPDELQRKFELDWSTLKPPEVAELVADYDAEIAFNDANLGALLDDLKRLGLDGSTLVVVTADHGEEFGDHGGFTHGHTLYDELIHVPLLIRLPGGRRGGERDATLARQIDLLPTILAEAGVAIPSGLPGRSLLAPRADDAPLEALSHTRLGRRDISALETKRWKVLEPLPAPAAGALVFDLAADPGEKHPVGAAHPAVAGYGAQRIALDAAAAALDLREPARPPALDPDTERRLRALGYAD
jgi:choline-sulfatase